MYEFMSAGVNNQSLLRLLTLNLKNRISILRYCYVNSFPAEILSRKTPLI
jgi:hypothetical protein